MGAKFIYQHRYWQIVNFRVAFQSQSFHLKISFIHMQMNQNVHVKKRVSVMRRTYKRGTKTRGGSHAIVNRKKTRLLYCTALYSVRPVFPNAWRSLGFPSPLWIQKQTTYRHIFSILSAMCTGACGPPEKLSLALVARSHFLRMIVRITYSKNKYSENERELNYTHT